jgi:hypothetical protein
MLILLTEREKSDIDEYYSLLLKPWWIRGREN